MKANEKQIDDLLKELDRYARNYDAYEYGLPIDFVDGNELNDQRKIVTEWLKKSFIKLSKDDIEEIHYSAQSMDRGDFVKEFISDYPNLFKEPCVKNLLSGLSPNIYGKNKGDMMYQWL